MSRNWVYETRVERFWRKVAYLTIGALLGFILAVPYVRAEPAKPLTVLVCPGQQASFRYEGGVMYVSCPPDPKPVLTVYGCVGPSLVRNTVAGPRGYEYTFKCQSWTTTVQSPK